MLRPTESSILWLQQFGRGLRKTDDDKRLTVIDYIGNHRTFLLTPHDETAVNGARRRPPLSDGPVLHDQSGNHGKMGCVPRCHGQAVGNGDPGNQ